MKIDSTSGAGAAQLLFAAMLTVGAMGTARPLPGGDDIVNCTAALVKMCDGAKRSSLGNCFVCVGDHQMALKQLGCSTEQANNFCHPGWSPSCAHPGVLCGPSNSSAGPCCSGMICDIQTRCPSGMPPRPGSRCGPTVEPSQCHTCQPPPPPPKPVGCGVAGTACSTSAPCCQNKGRCSSFLACLKNGVAGGSVCRFLPPPLKGDAPGRTNKAPSFEIAKGVHMPWLSNGAVGYPEHTQEQAAIETWLSKGGRGVDTAWSYKNQAQVGYALGNSSVPRAEVFLTTKIPCVGSAAAALRNLKLDLVQLNQKYVDLVLIHEPTAQCKNSAQRADTYRGLLQGLQLGLTRAVGVSNFDSAQMADCLAVGPVAVNQCSMHVGRHDDVSIRFAQAHNITYEAYSPLGGPDLHGKSVLTYPAVVAIAKAHNVSGAQVAMRWVLQQGVAVVTATGNAEYIVEDLAAPAAFTLTASEMARLSAVSGTPP
jgi:2,5-diketo-D-gluconate reductase B